MYPSYFLYCTLESLESLTLHTPFLANNHGVAKKNATSPVWDCFGFNRAETESQGRCLNKKK